MNDRTTSPPRGLHDPHRQPELRAAAPESAFRPPAIELEQLTKRFEGTAVVDNVSLGIAPGELFVLLGPSGSGKSTLLRMIAGLADVDAGVVRLHGRDVTHVSPKDRAIGFVFQHYALFRNMTVAEKVEFALRVRKVRAAARRERREELLQLVGLAGLAERYPRQLSGGQQQRVALARALAHQPDVLLLDEPFGALDAKIRLELRQALRNIQREIGLTTIFVTHDQEEAFELADRVRDHPLQRARDGRVRRGVRRVGSHRGTDRHDAVAHREALPGVRSSRLVRRHVGADAARDRDPRRQGEARASRPRRR